MADTKLSGLTALSVVPGNALIYVVSGGVSYKTTKDEFLASIATGVLTLSGDLVDNADPANPIILMPTFQQTLIANEGASGNGLNVRFGIGSDGFMEIYNQPGGFGTPMSLLFMDDASVGIMGGDGTGYKSSTVQVGVDSKIGIIETNSTGGINRQTIVAFVDPTAMTSLKFPAKATGDYIIATTSDIDNAVDQLIDGAPSDSNTLKELNDKIVAINAIIGGSTADGDLLVNTVAELLAVFSTYPEGADIAAVLAGKINSSDIINNLTQVVSGKVLDATQGKALKDLIDALTTVVGGKESSSNKDASGGYPGLTLFKINFRNVLNTFTSFFTNSNTAARTYTFQDRDGIIADDADLALKANKPSMMKLVTAYVLSNSTSLQKLFNVGSSGTGSFTALANKTYEFECGFAITGLSSTAGTVSFGILGTAGISGISYNAIASKGALVAASTAMIISSQVTTAMIITSSGNPTAAKGFISGIIVTSSAGSIQPAIATSIGTGAAQVEPNSYFKIREIGADSFTASSDIV